MWQVNLKHPEEQTEVAIFISDAVDEIDAKAKALAIFAGNNADLNLAEGFTPTLARKISYALIPDLTEVMYG